jgi:multiple sugar transport system permease protein
VAFEKIRDPSEKTLAVLLLAPAFLLIALIVVYPIGKLIYNSFFDLRLSGGSGAFAFVGLQNYKDAWVDRDFWNAASNTILITLITVPGALVVGLGLAMLANLPFKHKWPVRLALLLPWALPLSFAGLIFAWFFHTEYGFVDDVMRRYGSRTYDVVAATKLGIHGHLRHDHLENLFLHGFDPAGRVADDPQVSV